MNHAYLCFIYLSLDILKVVLGMDPTFIKQKDGQNRTCLSHCGRECQNILHIAAENGRVLAFMFISVRDKKTKND